MSFPSFFKIRSHSYDLIQVIKNVSSEQRRLRKKCYRILSFREEKLLFVYLTNIYQVAAMGQALYQALGRLVNTYNKELCILGLGLQWGQMKSKNISQLQRLLEGEIL